MTVFGHVAAAARIGHERLDVVGLNLADMWHGQ
jgi:hypothetical protein